jgi:hypothetical protein
VITPPGSTPVQIDRPDTPPSGQAATAVAPATDDELDDAADDYPGEADAETDVETGVESSTTEAVDDVPDSSETSASSSQAQPLTTGNLDLDAGIGPGAKPAAEREIDLRDARSPVPTGEAGRR